MMILIRFAAAAGILFAAAGFAQAPSAPAPPEPDFLLVYESDTRAYYRPCG